MNTHEAIEALRLKAFETNAPSDRHAYYTTLSKAFQNGELVVLSTLPIAGEAPEGWQLVPVKMTADMINAWSGGVTVTSDAVAYQTSFQDAWKRVLAASPSSPGKDGGQEVGSTHEERIALAAALTWDVSDITPDDVRGVIERLAAEGFRLQRIGGQENGQ